MAPQKGKKAAEKEQEMVDRITAQVTATLDSKLEMFLQAARAQPEQRTVPSPNVVRTRKRAREDPEPAVEIIQPEPRPKISKKANPKTSHTSLAEKQPSASLSPKAPLPAYASSRGIDEEQ